ncbi:hypothetical protein COU62_03075 [Candidatus Pacearchaeota archaeon CG10_big_fil_rev_8_21_14_0_10_35_219]|nr:MAG: hypothetical protein COU62_03075 [Candidatus Pacearchaeota archaeon CG10_big_fil_rev_8_21_14_0_10_35_219]PIY81841.1 MAG: hypothetical protein COY79_00555 [Candidatus Pacearchaeota archaeon CG_4_10_14_0_8_um_filter_35_169]PIZ80707.1 MAG: hypothetical protein COY00_00500 [Candidatus Pacearchaeota archaeon CG_4_10_14_0_2_um_filter_35_33]PJA69922.1 MAG: hypothetical protein CO155_02755 [Candidatus Pacearchaeota archaeon CG_4_9_14_3_um_filter_35_19]PJB94349.1 MAG: hypothetical protein CO081_
MENGGDPGSNPGRSILQLLLEKEVLGVKKTTIKAAAQRNYDADYIDNIYIPKTLFPSMLLRTHLVIGGAVALYFMPFVNSPGIFVFGTIIASLLPDVDSGLSRIGRKKVFKPVQLMVKHRGILHTYTFTVLVSVIIAFFWPVFALPFFMGWSFHLLADSFTKQGITPFWPLKAKSQGIVRTGGQIDRALFITFVIIDVILIIMLAAQAV